mgnify:CR=1 FL=1|jgi:hypothetical protein
MDDLQEKIKERAFALYLERGRQPGHAMEDWIRAEKEILRTVKETKHDGHVTGKKASSPSLPKHEHKITKKEGKPHDALVFSSSKQNVRTAYK